MNIDKGSDEGERRERRRDSTQMARR